MFRELSEMVTTFAILGDIVESAGQMLTDDTSIILLRYQLPGDNDPALGIDAVDLEHLLCKVDPDGGNCWHGRPSLVIRR